MAETTLEQVQQDVVAALKAGDRERAGTLRMLVNSLQQDAKEGGDGEAAVLRRELKRRHEAARAYRDGGDEERARAEELEAELIEAYMPEQISDEELASVIDDAIARSGAQGASDMGRVMGSVMPSIGDRADGGRVSAMVRERLARQDA